MAERGRTGQRILTLALLALVGWLAWDRFGPELQPTVVVPPGAEQLAAEARLQTPVTVEQLVSGYPQQRITELVAGPTPVPGAGAAHARGNQPATDAGNWVAEDVDPVKMVRWTPLIVTGERLIRNARLNPRRTPLQGMAPELLGELLQLYRRQIQAVVDAKAGRRQQEMLSRLAAGRLVPLESLRSELRPADLSWIEASLKRLPDPAPEARERHRRTFEQNALQRRLRLDAVTTLADGTAWAARHGELAGALAAYDEYERFLLTDYFASVVAFFTGHGCLTPAEAATLVEAFGREG